MPTGEPGKLVFLRGQEEIDIQHYEVPSPEPGAILTEVVQANICGSELHIWRGEHPLIQDGVLGHEALCRVLELGDGVETDYAGEPIKEGDLVAPAYFLTCGRCALCGIGEFRLCENAYREWSKPPDEWPHFHGTFATHYYIHPNQYFYKVSPDIDNGVAASANCALSQVLCGIDKIGLTANETVVIQGAGGLGLNAVAVATERGAETIVIDAVRERLDQAERFGADHIVDMTTYESVDQRSRRVANLTDGMGADVAIEVTGVPNAFSEGIRLLRPGGRYLEMGNIVPGKTTEFDPGKLTRKSIEVTSLMRYDPWYLHDAIRFLQDHAESYPFDELLDETFAIEDVKFALQRSAERKNTRASLEP